MHNKKGLIHIQYHYDQNVYNKNGFKTIPHNILHIRITKVIIFILQLYLAENQKVWGVGGAGGVYCAVWSIFVLQEQNLSQSW